MKQILFLTIFIFSTCIYANTAFKIPRSSVIELKEPSTNRVYPIFIKLPSSYDSNSDKKYPVIYLTDAWYSFQIVSGSTRFPMNSGVMKEAIIVGISYSKGSRGSSSRVRDFTPAKADNWKLETGNASGHSRFIREVVFSYIETNFRTEPSQRTFVGNSLGGLFSAYILFNYPEMFSSYIIGSPSVWFNNNYILSSPIRINRNPISVYLSVGSLETPEFGEQEDLVLGAKLLAEKINNQVTKGINFKFVVIEHASHATAFPTTAIQGLDWIYGKR